MLSILWPIDIKVIDVGSSTSGLWTSRLSIKRPCLQNFMLRYPDASISLFYWYPYICVVITGHSLSGFLMSGYLVCLGIWSPDTTVLAEFFWQNIPPKYSAGEPPFLESLFHFGRKFLMSGYWVCLGTRSPDTEIPLYLRNFFSRIFPRNIPPMNRHFFSPLFTLVVNFVCQNRWSLHKQTVVK